MILSRRRVLSGLIAAPAVLALGVHMPIKVFNPLPALRWEKSYNLARSCWQWSARAYIRGEEWEFAALTKEYSDRPLEALSQAAEYVFHRVFINPDHYNYRRVYP